MKRDSFDVDIHSRIHIKSDIYTTMSRIWTGKQENGVEADKERVVQEKRRDKQKFTGEEKHGVLRY